MPKHNSIFDADSQTEMLSGALSYSALQLPSSSTSDLTVKK